MSKDKKKQTSWQDRFSDEQERRRGPVKPDRLSQQEKADFQSWLNWFLSFEQKKEMLREAEEETRHFEHPLSSSACRDI